MCSKFNHTHNVAVHVLVLCPVCATQFHSECCGTRTHSHTYTYTYTFTYTYTYTFSCTCSCTNTGTCACACACLVLCYCVLLLLCPSGLLILISFIRHSECLEESAACCSRPILKLKMVKIHWFGEPLKHVITIRGQILASRTGDDLPAPPCVHSKRSVCGFKTSPCVPAPRAHVETHVRVVPAYMGTFLNAHTKAFVNPHSVFF